MHVNRARKKAIRVLRRASRAIVPTKKHSLRHQGVASLRDATRKGVERFTPKPHSIRHSRMLPIVLVCARVVNVRRGATDPLYASQPLRCP